ncbi:MAG: ATP-grasp domain-containing protein [Candidatus Niyogibacteria bacterium]|nr:MAG: ATP-grasp domain-containing protein [Candidatus Niyogibacteria bacterium]
MILYNAANIEPLQKIENHFDSELNDQEDVQDVKDVKQALEKTGLNVRTLNLKNSDSKITAALEKIQPDVIFNLCVSLHNHPHRSLTEMYVAGWLELLKLPYTGAPPMPLGLSLNKMRCKQILRSSGIPVPPSVYAPIGEKPNLESITPPFIIKPVREDGSVGITKKSVVGTFQEAEEKIQFIHGRYKQPALVEEFIEGREFTVVVVDNPPRIFGIGELDFSGLDPTEPKVFSYEAKWNSTKREYGTRARFPAQIETILKNRLEKIALKAFQLLGCRDYARIDIRVSENRRPYILEVNSNPDISLNEEFGDAAKVAGIDYNDLIRDIVENALRRGNKTLT